MMFDKRHNYYNLIIESGSQWSTDWTQFVGFSYIPFLTEFEDFLFTKYDMNEWHRWMQNNWHLSIHIALIYLFLLPILTIWMKTRVKPYKLEKQFFIWNSSMAIFCIIGVIRCLPQFVDILWRKGLTASFCESDYYLDLRLDLWYLIFVVSKAPELIDTIFIILQKRELLTLHWVHHSLTLIYSWYVFGNVPATANWMVNMNFLAHALSYSYFAFKYYKIKLKYVNICVLLVEITQMIFGLYINYTVIDMKTNGFACDMSLANGVFGFLLYFLFLILFIRLFTDVLKKYKKD